MSSIYRLGQLYDSPGVVECDDRLRGEIIDPWLYNGNALGISILSEEKSMADHFISRGFEGKRRQAGVADRVPPGQYVVSDFPVLSAGPTPRTSLDQWTFTIEGLVREPARWSWQEFLALPMQTFVVDIHCVTKWTKLDTRWAGVSLDTLFEQIELDRKAMYLTAYGDGGYTTNIPITDAINGQAFVA